MGTTRTDWLQAVSMLSGINFNTLKIYAKQLPKAGLIESVGRGPWASELSPAGAVVLFLAIFGSDKNSVVVESVKRLLSCVSNDASGRRLLSSVLQEIFSDPDKASKIGAIHICKTNPEVEIFNDDGGSWCFLMPEEWDSEKAKVKPGRKAWEHLEGFLIHQLAILLNASRAGDPKHDEYIEGLQKNGWKLGQ